ncbi:RxLR effector protein [Phytophthora megakarya]|uniref:RxLR effector protein n=1 Tax=Phytophthora megakarya TaxID=4795 RepID=A0A225WIW4_9STRA|nr:RxLR effector protein [Phytophthora megakarya]
MNELSTKLKAASQYFKKGISSAKLSWAEKKRAFDVRGLIKKGTSETELLNKQVTSDEYFKAMRLDPRFKERSGAWTKDALAKNPKLREKFGKWIAYDDFVKRKLPGVTA